MLHIKKPSYMFFNSDDEFYRFCVVPELVTDADVLSTDFNLSPDYYNALNNSVFFVIKDENSQIYKRNAVSYRTITKQIENLLPYYGEKFIGMYGND